MKFLFLLTAILTSSAYARYESFEMRQITISNKICGLEIPRDTFFLAWDDNGLYLGDSSYNRTIELMGAHVEEVVESEENAANPYYKTYENGFNQTHKVRGGRSIDPKSGATLEEISRKGCVVTISSNWDSGNPNSEFIVQSRVLK